MSAGLPLLKRKELPDPAPRPRFESIRILMTQALPLVRIDHSERLARRELAEWVGWVALTAALIALALAIAGTLVA